MIMKHKSANQFPVLFIAVSLLVAIVVAVIYRDQAPVTMTASAYNEHIKRHDAYMAKEETLYQEHQALIASLRDMVNRDPTPAALEAWRKKMKDWEKRDETFEREAPSW